MTDQFSGIEKLLDLPQGSTNGVTPDQATKLLADGVKKKTNQLEKNLEKVETLEQMTPPDLVKCGIDIESLENDKITIRKEAWEVYRITKAILVKYREDTKDQIDVNDRMYAAGAKLGESVINSLDKLNAMNMKFRQEEEMKGLTLLGEEEDGKKEMSPGGWLDLVEESRNRRENKNENAKEAEIVEDEDEKEKEKEKE